MTPKQRKRLVRNRSKSDDCQRWKMISFLGRNDYDMHMALCRMKGARLYEFRKRWGVVDSRKAKLLNRLTRSTETIN